MSESIRMEWAEQNGVIVVSLAGRLDAAAAHLLKEQLSELREKGHQNLVLLARDVTFVASSGIGTLLVAANDLRTDGGRLVIACPSSAVSSVIDLLNLSTFLHIADSEQSAFEMLEVTDEPV